MGLVVEAKRNINFSIFESRLIAGLRALIMARGGTLSM